MSFYYHLRKDVFQEYYGNLKKPVYGLADAVRGWHLALDKQLTNAGCEKCKLDPAIFISLRKKVFGK